MGISTHFGHASRAIGLIGAAGILAASSGLLATPAFAASSTSVFTCDNGSTLTVLTHDNHASDRGGWGAGTVVDGGSGKMLPTSFAMAAHDDTAGQYLFQSGVAAKGNGNANHNQQPVTCEQSMTSTLADLVAQEGPPPGGLPAWASESDIVTVTFTVTAVPVG